MTKQTNARACRFHGKSILKGLTLVTLILTALSVPARAASSCGPGALWVRTCGGGSDKFNTSATIHFHVLTPPGPDTLAVFTGPTEIVRFDAQSGPPAFITTDVVSIDLTDSQGSGFTLRTGLPGLPPSFGRITENPSPFTTAVSFFDVFFEMGGTPFGPLHNTFPLRLQATIDHVPPTFIQYTHNLPPGGITLFDGGGVARVQLTSANHTPGPAQDCSIAAPTYAGPPLWLGNTQKCALGITPFAVTGDCVDNLGVEATLTPKVSVRQAAVAGGGWETWSSPPFAESHTPFVGFPCASADDVACERQGVGASTETIDLLTPAGTVALEVEPNVFNVFPVSVQFFDGPAGTGNVLASTVLGVQGNSGARLFAGICPSAVIQSVKVSLPTAAALGFAFGQLRSDQFAGIFAPEEPAPLGPVEVPADATSNAPPPPKQ